MVPARHGAASPAGRDLMEPSVVYVAGMPRSGSTLLGRLLADRFEVQFAGELLHLDALCAPAERCGCGVHLATCSYWAGVRERLLHEDPGTVRTELRGLATRFPRTPIQGGHAAELLADVVGLLAAANPRPIVDTSKVPSLGMAHREAVPRGQVHVVHLLRDPSAVIASIAHRPLRKREQDDPKARLRTFPPLSVGLRWRHHNRLARELRHSSNSYLQVHLEDLVRDPDTVLAEIADQASLLPRAGEPPLDHSLRGNPSRFDPLRLDPGRVGRAQSTSNHAVSRLVALAGRTWGYPVIEPR